jgi:hypothetical protein
MPNNETASVKPLRMESKWIEENEWSLVMELDTNYSETLDAVMAAIDRWNDGRFIMRIVPNN